MGRGTSRQCQWCGCQFRVEFPTGTALYCKRSHKTAAEKWRKRFRVNPPQPCPVPSVPAEPLRGPAVTAARRIGGYCWNCQCGHFHALDADALLTLKLAKAGTHE